MERINELIKKYQNGTATPKESEVVEQYFMETMSQEPVEEHDRYKQEVFETLDQRYQLTQANTRFIRRYESVIKYAAIAIISLSVVIWIYVTNDTHQMMSKNGDDKLKAEDVLPGGDKAILTLFDGEIIELSAVGEGIVVAKDIRYLNGEVLSSFNAENDNEVLHHTLALQTPRGGTYHVTLSDGTKVWLNAESRLQYPLSFTGNMREVILDGEAYFEVERDNNQPFVVRTSGQNIKVLGTSFNVSAYASDSIQKTTLISGKVRVEDTEQSQSVLLSPGEQAQLAVGLSLDKSNVDVINEMAWKEGRFSFEYKKFDQVMKELARWYDLDVVYEGNIPDLEFFGGIKRDTNLANVLALLENSNISYRLTDKRQLIITQVKK